MNATKQALSTGTVFANALSVDRKQFFFEDAVLSAGSFWSKVKTELGTMGDVVALPTEEGFVKELDEVGAYSTDPELNYGYERLAHALNTAREVGFKKLMVKLH